MQYNEEHILPVFLKHYSKYFDKKDIYIIDHGSTIEFDYTGYNVIRVPRDKPFCEQSRLELINNLTTGLLNYYDYGVYADCDELICLDYFSETFDQPVHYVVGFDVFKKNDRLYGILDSFRCKPLIFNRPIDWQLGFHGCQYEPESALSIPMAHIRYLDENLREERLNLRTYIRENMDKIEKSLGSNHHWTDNEDYNNFKDVVNNFDNQTITKFDYAPSNVFIKPISKDAYHTIEGGLDNVIFDITDYFVDLV